MKTGSSLLAAAAPPLLSVLRWVGVAPITKFETRESIKVIVCGGDAGKFTTVCAGFGVGKPGMATYRLSFPVTKPVVALPRGAASTRLPALVDPRTAAAAAAKPTLAKRTGTIRGPVALLDISKGGGKPFLDGVEAFLRRSNAGVEIKRFAKPTFSRVAPPALVDEICAACAHVVIGLAD